MYPLTAVSPFLESKLALTELLFTLKVIPSPLTPKRVYWYFREGVFGQFEQDGVVVRAGDGDGDKFQINWEAERHGK